MQQLDPRVAAFLTPRIGAPRMFGGAGPADTGQASMEALMDLLAGGKAPPPQGPASPAPQPPQAPALGSQAGAPRPGPRNWLRVIDGVLGGRTFSESIDYEDARGEARQQQEAARAQQAARIEAFREAVDDQGRFNPQAYFAAHDRLGIAIDPDDFDKILKGQPPVFADDVTVGGIRFRPGQDGSYTEVARDNTPDWRLGPDRDRDGIDDWYNANPSPSPRPGTPTPNAPPPPPGFVIDRPTNAPATVGAAPQGFRDRSEMVGFVQQRYPGRPTSGYRTQAEQDALVRRGVTSATRSAHTYAEGQDFVPDVPMSEWPRIKAELEATGRFRSVRIETGQGRNQGTGAHIHLEPR